MALHLAKVDGYLTKPYEQAQLFDLLAQVIQRRSKNPSAAG
jgi:YesN/AraC family two-component response regulator